MQLSALNRATIRAIEPLDVPKDIVFVISCKDGRFILKPHTVAPFDCDGCFTAQYYKTKQAVLVMKPENRYSAECLSRHIAHRIPEKKALGFSDYSLAQTDYTALILYHSIGDNLVVTPSARDDLDLLLMQFFLADKTAQDVAQYKLNKVLPKMPNDFENHPINPLDDFQKMAVLASLDKEGYALFMEQGTGKTCIAISRMCLEAKRVKRKTNAMYKCLIVCPKQVRRNWCEEFHRFATVPGKVTVITGGKLSRTKAVLDGIRYDETDVWSACVISHDSVAATWEALSRVPWDLVIVDESHNIKAPGTKRSKAIRKFNETGRARQRMLLTGTPIGNTVMDLWSQLEFLYEGASGFTSFDAFRNFHGVYSKAEGKGYSKLEAVTNIPILQERLARLSLMMKKAETNMHLPPKLPDIYEVEMTTKQRNLYDTLAEQLAAEIEEMLEETGDNKSIVVSNILVKLLRLAQVASGHIKWDGALKPEQIDTVNPKVDAVIDMLTDEGRDANGKTIIWCAFDEDVRVLSNALHTHNINHVGYKPQIIEKYRVADASAAEQVFNMDPSCLVFIGNPGSGGSGLNLLGYDRNDPDNNSMNTDHEIFFSSDWSALKRSQAEERAVRRGTRVSVRITDLIVPNTVDAMIRDRVKNKIKSANNIQDIRDILKELL